MATAQFKNSLVLYAVQTLEKIVDIFIRDRALKECPLCKVSMGVGLLHQLKHLFMTLFTCIQNAVGHGDRTRSVTS